MGRKLRIGTRDSKLAVWQARQVQQLLEDLGEETELVMVKSPGDIDLSTPLHQFGGTGIFTKILDDALLNNTADIAVHSLKDYPTETPRGLKIPAVLKRGNPSDILVYKDSVDFMKTKGMTTIATGSIRRTAQWKSRYPDHHITGLRGNVQTRLQKLQDHNWQGAIFARAGLERIGLLPNNYISLDWMIPAPAQGVIGIACRENEEEILSVLSAINHQETFSTSAIERQFLQTVEGGCSAPVGAHAWIEGELVYLKAGVFALDGSHKVIFEDHTTLDRTKTFGHKAALDVLDKGGKEIMQNIKHA